MTARSRNFCFTLNNYTDAHIASLAALTCKYIIYGKEVAPTTLTPHLQGFVVFSSMKTATQVRALIPGHITIATGTVEANVVYCSKDGQVTEHGTKPLTQAQKGDTEIARYQAAWVNAKDGNYEEIPADIRIKCYRTLKEIAKDYMGKPVDAPDVTGLWIWGPSGVGKSRYVRDTYQDLYFKMANKWFCGYQQEKNVLIDDLDPSHAKLAYHLKIWMDRYSFLAEHKGSSSHIRPDKIIITSQYSIEEVFPDEPTREAIRRRCQVIHMPGQRPVPRMAPLFTPPPLRRAEELPRRLPVFTEMEVTGQEFEDVQELGFNF